MGRTNGTETRKLKEIYWRIYNNQCITMEDLAFLSFHDPDCCKLVVEKILPTQEAAQEESLKALLEERASDLKGTKLQIPKSRIHNPSQTKEAPELELVQGGKEASAKEEQFLDLSEEAAKMGRRDTEVKSVEGEQTKRRRAAEHMRRSRRRKPEEENVDCSI